MLVNLKKKSFAKEISQIHMPGIYITLVSLYMNDMKRVFTACSADIMDYKREFKYVTSIYFITQNSTSMIFFKKKIMKQ